MIKQTLLRLRYLVDTLPASLAKIPEEQWDEKPGPDKWNRKEILGHLIDSATNNHQRFLRGQFENIPIIIYDQNSWNSYSHYDQMSSAHLIAFWTIYNRHLIEIIQAMPEESYIRKCKTNEPLPVTLEWLIVDYVSHMEHHLHQIAAY